MRHFQGYGLVMGDLFNQSFFARLRVSIQQEDPRLVFIGIAQLHFNEQSSRETRTGQVFDNDVVPKMSFVSVQLTILRFASDEISVLDPFPGKFPDVFSRQPAIAAIASYAIGDLIIEPIEIPCTRRIRCLAHKILATFGRIHLAILRLHEIRAPFDSKSIVD
jgi:hypothetical protein